MTNIRESLWVLGFCTIAVGCATGQPPHQQMARAQAAVRAAEEVGAEDTPDAALHLKLARDQVQQAAHLADARNYDQAAKVLRQAELDAELAIAISERQRAVQRADEATEQLDTLEREGGMDEPMGDGMGGEDQQAPVQPQRPHDDAQDPHQPMEPTER